MLWWVDLRLDLPGERIGEDDLASLALFTWRLPPVTLRYISRSSLPSSHRLPPATCPLSIDLTQNCGGAKITFGIVHQICFCCSNLIFWIVMRCGIANVGWRVENWWTTPLSGADVLPDSLNNRGSWCQSGQVRIVNNHVEIVDAWKLHLNCADLEGILWLFILFLVADFIC